MRAGFAPPLVLAALLLVLPAAGAAALELTGGRSFEADLAPGGSVLVEVPFVAGAAGSVYAKILPTPGNAVHDGARANGTATTGWRVSFALQREGAAEPEDLGTPADASPTPLAPVAEGERLALLVRIHAPADALLGGAAQRVHVALAYRGAAAESGLSSGASMDASRGLTFHVRLAGGDAVPADDEEVPAVAPLPERTTSAGGGASIAPASLAPTWALVVGLLLLAGILAALVAIAILLSKLLRETRKEGASRRVPVREEKEESTARAEAKR